MLAFSLRSALLVLGLCLGLVACDSAEDRAEAYFASAQELIDAGDLDRAVIELRNVFELAPNHVEARETMARLMLQRNDKRTAYGQYLRLVEQVPDHVEGRTVLAEIAFEARNWEEFSRHGTQVEALAPDAPRTQLISLVLRYQEALEARDGPARDALRMQAEILAAEAPDNALLQQVLFDAYIRDGALDLALQQLDKMLAKSPDNRRLYSQRLGLLEQLRDFAALESQLRQMVTRFADDPEPKSQLIEFLMTRGEIDEAEAFLRGISDPAAEDPSLFIDLVRFLAQVRGPDAARAELEAALGIAARPDQLRTILAALDFENGAQDEAINALQSILAQSEGIPDDVNPIRITLARMLEQTGNNVGARRLVDEVMQSDSDNVEGLKMQAAWMIRSDDTDGAIAALRQVLDAAPKDVTAINLTAQAYARAGNHELSQDFLALAVDASDNAPDPSLRYARVLAEDERYLAAEEILISALRRARGNSDLLVLLGEIYLASEDYSRADQVIRRLREFRTDRTDAVANALQARLLGSREGVEQALGFLEDLAAREDAGLNTQIALLRARLSSGQTKKALEQAKGLVAENPGNPSLRFILATAHAANGAPDIAETLLADLVSEDKTRMHIWTQLYRLQRIQGKDELAYQTLLDGLAVDPDNRELLWAQAGMLEAVGDIDGAIANYDQIYQRNSGDLVAANNLASLLATYKADEANLERAWLIARRLRNTDIPAFQDTYGWIAFRRGDAEEALPYLESAAARLPQDPIVQFHLGQVYTAVEQPDAALAAYQRAIELAGDDDTRTQFDIAKNEITRLIQAQNDP